VVLCDFIGKENRNSISPINGARPPIKQVELNRHCYLMPPYCSSQPDIDLASVVADNIDDTESQPVVEQFAKPLIAYARMPLAQGANELFPRRCEDRRCGAGHISGHAVGFQRCANPARRSSGGLLPVNQRIWTDGSILPPRRQVIDLARPRRSSGRLRNNMCAERTPDIVCADPKREARACCACRSSVCGCRGEHNGRAGFKNAIDHASRPYGQSAFSGKPAGVIGVSVGAIGTAVAQQHLRNTLAYLDVPTLGQPEAFMQAKEGLFGSDGSIGAASRQFLQGWVDRYVGWVKKHAA
jgi:NADPH-dependent FMN reductase